MSSFKGNPQALLLDFAYASPLNENDQYMIKSTSPTMVVELEASMGRGIFSVDGATYFAASLNLTHET